jgi:hypothetical protein
MSSMAKAAGWIAGVLILLGACAAPESVVLHYIERHPPTAGKVDVLLERPVRAHKVFALLEDSYGGSPEEVNARLAAKGREIGADAVVISHVNDKTVTEWVLVDPCFRDPHCWPYYRPVKFKYRSVRAKAIKYTVP